VGIAGIRGIGHIKLPVSDVAQSARWYVALLDMRLATEFVEQGELRGVELVEPGSGLRIALRERAFCAGQPTLTGFDVFSVEMTGVDGVEGLARRCDELDVDNSGVHYFQGGAALDIPDPDGTVVRIHHTGQRPPFLGVDSVGSRMQLYEKPRFFDLPTLAEG
jgi:catechol 2,3-dioxygenase-like lactoylglutathione lyase family enzyme